MSDPISEHNPKCAAIVWPNGKVKCNCHVAEIERLQYEIEKLRFVIERMPCTCRVADNPDSLRGLETCLRCEVLEG